MKHHDIHSGVAKSMLRNVTVQVPATAAMAVQLRSVAKHEEDERAEIKRLVLKANKDLDLAGSAGLNTFKHKNIENQLLTCLAD